MAHDSRRRPRSSKAKAAIEGRAGKPGLPVRAPTRVPPDIALLHGPTEDGQGARILRFTQGSVQAGEVRPVREGQNVAQSELVRLSPLSPHAPLCAIETVHAPAAAPNRPIATQPASEEAGRSGPARVSNDAYRKNWNAIFGSPKKARPAYSVN